uniref:Fungal lipase-type domain-containing protein n=1 Tax=Alexandrium monilatum TaxID=311494 RepID=A0A7S4PSZ6_9DINO
MASTGSYAESLLAAPDCCREQFRHACLAYNDQILDDGSFPTWECLLSSAALPSQGASLMAAVAEEEARALRVVGRARRPRPCESPYAAVAEVAFRGTYNAANWATNLAIELEDVKVGDCRQGLAHRGFQQAYLAMRDLLGAELERSLSALEPCPAGQVLLLLTGHSMGGALAALAAYDLAPRARYAVRCVTWGCPRLGDAAFARAFVAAVPHAARFITRHDPVPRLLSNPADPHDSGALVSTRLTAQYIGAMQLPQRAIGAVGYCHACPGVVLDPGASTLAHALVGSLEATSGASDALTHFFTPHENCTYSEALDGALRRRAAWAFARRASVGTWLSTRRKARLPDPQELLRGCGALVADLASSGRLPELLRDFQSRLDEVTRQGPELLQTAEGSALLQEAQERLLGVLPLLGLGPGGADLKHRLVAKLENSSSGRQLLQRAEEQLLEVRSKPDLLLSYVDSLNSFFKGGAGSAPFAERCASVLDKARSHYLEFLGSNAAQQQLRASGIEFDEEGRVDVKRVLERGQALLETPTGQEVLRRTQACAADVVSGLEARAAGVSMPKEVEECLLQLEQSDQGRAMIAWGREQLSAARQDPSYLRNLLVPADQTGSDAVREWCSDFLLADSDARGALLEKAGGTCLDALRSPGAQQLLRSLGVEFDEDGGVRLEQVLERSGQLLQTEEGRGILVKVQEALVASLPSLEDRADGLGLDKAVSALGRTAQGRKLLSWGRRHLEEVQRNPEALSRWLASKKAGAVAQAAQDAAARTELLESVRARFLEFLLGQLPLIEVPNIEGEKEGKAFTVSNISLEGLKVPPEGVQLGLAGSDASAPQAEVQEGPPGAAPRTLAHGELLRATARGVGLEIPDLRWSFEQRHFPYAHGIGSALARVRGVHIVVALAVKRAGSDGRLHPHLSLASSSVVIEEVLIDVRESSFSWLYNTLMHLFRQTVKEFITASLQSAIAENIGTLLTPLNEYVEPIWPSLPRS